LGPGQASLSQARLFTYTNSKGVKPFARIAIAPNSATKGGVAVATDLATLEGFLTEEGLKYSVHGDYIRTSFATDVYRDQDGDGSVFIIARMDEEGEYFKLLAPNLYNYPPDGPSRAEVFRVLLGVCWRSKLIKYEYDERDGEIRAIIEFPLEDSAITKRQFLRCLNGLVQIVDEYHPAIESAINGGPGSLDEAEETSENLRRADRIYRLAGVEKRRTSALDVFLEE
jgi:hypothetical protein